MPLFCLKLSNGLKLGWGGRGGNPNFKSSFIIFMWFVSIFCLFFTSTKAIFYFFSHFSFLRIFLVALFPHLLRESCLSFCYLLRYFLRQHSENVTLFHTALFVPCIPYHFLVWFGFHVNYITWDFLFVSEFQQVPQRVRIIPKLPSTLYPNTAWEGRLVLVQGCLWIDMSGFFKWYCCPLVFISIYFRTQDITDYYCLFTFILVSFFFLFYILYLRSSVWVFFFWFWFSANIFISQLILKDGFITERKIQHWQFFL